MSPLKKKDMIRIPYRETPRLGTTTGLEKECFGKYVDTLRLKSQQS